MNRILIPSILTMTMSIFLMSCSDDLKVPVNQAERSRSALDQTQNPPGNLGRFTPLPYEEGDFVLSNIYMPFNWCEHSWYTIYREIYTFGQWEFLEPRSAKLTNFSFIDYGIVAGIVVATFSDDVNGQDLTICTWVDSQWDFGMGGQPLEPRPWWITPVPLLAGVQWQCYVIDEFFQGGWKQYGNYYQAPFCELYPEQWNEGLNGLSSAMLWNRIREEFRDNDNTLPPPYQNATRVRYWISSCQSPAGSFPSWIPTWP